MFLSASVENIPDLSSLFISSVNAKGHPLCPQSICFSIPLLIWMHGDKWKAAGNVAGPKAMVQLLVPKRFHKLCAELQCSKCRSILPLPPPEPRAATAPMWERGQLCSHSLKDKPSRDPRGLPGDEKQHLLLTHPRLVLRTKTLIVWTDNFSFSD